MAAGNVAPDVCGPEMRSNGWWSAWPWRTEIGATEESREHWPIWATKSSGHKAAFEAPFSSFEPPMRVSHHIDPQPSGVGGLLEQAGEKALQSAQAAGKKAMRMPALRHTAMLLAHLAEAVSLDQDDLAIPDLITREQRQGQPCCHR